MNIFLFSSVLIVVLISIVGADEIAALPRSQSNEIAVISNVIVYQSRVNEAQKILNQTAWMNRCFQDDTKNSTSFFASLKGRIFKGNSKKLQFNTTQNIEKSIETVFTSIAAGANKHVNAFENAYNKQTRTSTFTDIEFEKAKSDFNTYATKLKTLRDQLAKENPNDYRIQKIGSYCTDLLMNTWIMNSIDLKKSAFNRLKVFKKPGILLGYTGQKVFSKLGSFKKTSS
ncbi:uncharacterized protein LOC116348321 isoform X2 [Contarinia nasturtii]|uniref:uncharacterized protein LOC116348321 isoform X2 n=1 Tax=Contarinia nasturtii TaxID=265458 RepID=UPI0012D45A26|nr:uncharacterized protein LOC116348321 isoform X2 [Contarinia nasturtii]